MVNEGMREQGLFLLTNQSAVLSLKPQSFVIVF